VALRLGPLKRVPLILPQLANKPNTANQVGTITDRGPALAQTHAAQRQTGDVGFALFGVYSSLDFLPLATMTTMQECTDSELISVSRGVSSARLRVDSEVVTSNLG
jgi:hypothetical protein